MLPPESPGLQSTQKPSNSLAIDQQIFTVIPSTGTCYIKHSIRGFKRYQVETNHQLISVLGEFWAVVQSMQSFLGSLSAPHGGHFQVILGQRGKDCL